MSTHRLSSELGGGGDCVNQPSVARAAYGNLACAVGGLLAAVVLAEFATRLLIPIPLHPQDTFLDTGASAVQAADALPRWLRPNVSTRHRETDFDVAVSTNSHGLRDREIPYAKTSGVTRVLSLGDSFAFGYGVDVADCYCKRTEARLGSGWEVVNAGVPSWGTADELDFLLSEGFRYSPDVVVLCYFRNDLHDNRARGTYRIDAKGRLRRVTPLPRQRPEEVDAHRIAVKDPILGDICIAGGSASRETTTGSGGWWALHSNLYRLARQAASRVHQRATGPAREDVAAQLEYEKRLTGLLLAEVTRQCAQRGVDMIILWMPSREETTQWRQNRAPYEGEVARVTELARAAGAEVVDLAPVLAAAGVKLAYFPNNAHINARGHDLVSATLAERIRDHRTEGKQP